MKHVVVGLTLAIAALSAPAGARETGDTGTAGAGVQQGTPDQCMWVAAVRASYTSARDADIYGMARSQCGHGRAPRTAEEIATAASFPALIAGLRERRRTHDALYGISEVAYAR